jgi:hypothetical protein
VARHNPRLAKLSRPYTVEELSTLFEVNKQTVARWIKDGMKVSVIKRPMLILGADVRSYLEQKQNLRKRPCSPGQLFCVGCKVALNPEGDCAQLRILNALVGDLTGICPCCKRQIHRKVSLLKRAAWQGNLRLTEVLG